MDRIRIPDIRVLSVQSVAKKFRSLKPIKVRAMYGGRSKFQKKLD
jgi:hypothetical protein